MKYLSFGLFFLFIFSFSQCGEAAIFNEPITVTVVELDDHPTAGALELSLLNVGKAATEFVIQNLVVNKNYMVMENDELLKNFSTSKEKIKELIKLNSNPLKEKIFGTKYVISGDVIDVSISEDGTSVSNIGDVDIGTLNARVILKLIDTESGDIIMAAKGEGKSKTSFVNVAANDHTNIMIGTKSVTQDSVTSAVQKASVAAIDLLTTRLYGGENKNK